MGRSLAAGAPPNFRATATCRHRFRLGYGENQIGQVLPEGAESGRSDQLAKEPPTNSNRLAVRDLGPRNVPDLGAMEPLGQGSSAVVTSRSVVPGLLL